MNRLQVALLGNLVADVVARPVDEIPATGSLHPESVSFYPGGCAGNSATVFARLGVTPHLVGCVGKDAFGLALLEAYRQRGIETAAVQQVQEAATGITIVLIDSRGERRFISSEGANRYLHPWMFPPHLLDRIGSLHIAGFFAARGLEDGALRPLLAEARCRGIYTSLDTVGGSARARREQLFPLLPHLDLLLLNEDEGEKITGHTDREGIIRFVLERGARTVILKLGEKGCMTAGSEGSYAFPAYPVSCVDTTGAGDSFAAALLAARAHGNSFEEALRWASAAGAATVQAVGATGQWEGWDALAAITGVPPRLRGSG